MTNNPVPLLGYIIDHRLQQEPDAKDLTIKVETEIHQYEWGPIKSSFHEPLKKRELYYFLIGVGIEKDDAQFMINDMNLYVLRNFDGLRGVLTLLLNVWFPSIEPINCDE